MSLKSVSLPSNFHTIQSGSSSSSCPALELSALFHMLPSLMGFFPLKFLGP